MEKRFKKVITNPATGRKRLLSMDKLGKRLMGKIGFAPAQLKVMLIALVLQKSKVIGNQIQIHPITCPAENGIAKALNQ